MKLFKRNKQRSYTLVIQERTPKGTNTYKMTCYPDKNVQLHKFTKTVDRYFSITVMEDKE